MKEQIFISGHKNPDSDSVCAALGYAALKKQIDNEKDYIPIKLGNLNRETEYILNYFNIETPKTLTEVPKGSTVILVDHNEKTQTLDNIEEAQIVEVIDHHRVNLKTANPLYYRCEIVGSTSTIVYKIFKENNIVPSKNIAGILAGAIISDTLLLKSPTTTTSDKIILEELCHIAGIKAETFAKDMFKKGTSLKGKTIKEILNQDFKVFEIKDKKIGIGQVNTMDIDGFKVVEKEMLTFMEETTAKEGFSLILLLLTDIYEESSLLLSVGDIKDVVNDTFNVVLKNNTAFLPGVVSRKKQVVPKLTEVVEKL